MAKSNTSPPGPAALLLECLDCSFDKRSWHGPNLSGALRGVSPAEALVRVAGRKSIWEQLLHAAYWKHRVLAKLAGEAAPPFPRKGSDWVPVPADASARSWRDDLAMLKEIHRQLRGTVERLPADRLAGQTIWLIHGAAAHDVYHAGQIKLLRRLLKGKPAGQKRLGTA